MTKLNARVVQESQDLLQEMGVEPEYTLLVAGFIIALDQKPLHPSVNLEAFMDTLVAMLKENNYSPTVFVVLQEKWEQGF